jgi:hypothetical protein
MVLTGVRRHGRRRYFDHMKVVAKRHRQTITQHLVFRKYAARATIPVWVGPDAWPYL